MNTNAEKLRIAATRCTRHNADVALLCEHALTAADRLEALEDEYMRFFENWHNERRKREAMAVHYDHLCSLVLAAGMLAPHGNGAKAILDEAEQYMVSAAESWRRPNAELRGASVTAQPACEASLSNDVLGARGSEA